jgi:hypothetical protein
MSWIIVVRNTKTKKSYIWSHPERWVVFKRANEALNCRTWREKADDYILQNYRKGKTAYEIADYLNYTRTVGKHITHDAVRSRYQRLMRLHRYVP